MKPATQAYDLAPQHSGQLTKLDSVRSAQDIPLVTPQRAGFWKSPQGRRLTLVGVIVTACLVLVGVAVGIWAGVKDEKHPGGVRATLGPAPLNLKPFGDNPQLQMMPDCASLAAAMRLTAGANLAADPRNTFGISFGSWGRQNMEEAGPALGDAKGSNNAAGSTADYSSTNVQVDGVDESDIVKTDGQYIYVASGGQLVITRVTGSASEAANSVGVVSRTNVTEALLGYGPEGCAAMYSWGCGSRYGLAGSFRAAEMLLHGDVLLLLGSAYEAISDPVDLQQVWGSAYNSTVDTRLATRTFPTVVAAAWNVSDRTAPSLLRVSEVEGYYSTGRLVGGVAYIAVSTTPHVAVPLGWGAGLSDALIRWHTSVLGGSQEQLVMPRWRSTAASDNATDFQPICNCSQVGLPPNMTSQSFLTVLGLAMEAGTYTAQTVGNMTTTRELQAGDVVGQSTVAGPWTYGSPAVMASSSSLYVAMFYSSSEEGQQPTVERPITTNTDDDQWTVRQGSLLVAFSLSRGLVEMRAIGQAPGSLINQWAMDEQAGALRVATTVQGTWSGNGVQTSQSQSGVFVLSATTLQQVGSVTGLGIGDRIQAVRFLGNRGYVVTFRQVDPLYVLGLEDPANPKLVGELKIPGFSQYLHPVGSSMLLGVGQAASDTGRATGLKLSLFDVADPAHPIEAATVQLGGAGSWTEVAQDHKAFMYMQPDIAVPRALISLPVTLSSNAPACQPGASSPPSSPQAFQGALIYELTWRPGHGSFSEMARISHLTQQQLDAQYSTTVAGGQEFICNVWCEASRVRRSVRVGSVLYTLSDSQLVASTFDHSSDATAGYGQQLWSGGLLHSVPQSTGLASACWVYTMLQF